MPDLDLISGTPSPLVTKSDKVRTYALKRPIDIAIASTLLVLLSPLMAAIAISILISDGRPILFRQTRPGLRGQPFTLLKFRTMRDPSSHEHAWTTDHARVSRFGRGLRRTSLDELPTLWTVLAGSMSLVGPRPLLEEYLPKYSEKHSHRHDVRPGVTGLAQVLGRRDLTFGQRLDLDVSYVESVSLALDVRILIKTLVVPFQRGDDPNQSLQEVDDVGFHFPPASADQRQDRWEVGSHFPAVDESLLPTPVESWLPHASRLLSTGRQAILSAFLHGQRTQRWARLWVPAYFCPSVTRYLSSIIEVVRYPSAPDIQSVLPSLAQTDAVLGVSYFGLPPDVTAHVPATQLIVDATHDPLAPWLADTPARFVIASLRKTLPIPDGGLIWSTQGGDLPEATTLSDASSAWEAILAAMRAKSAYLTEGTPSKELFLAAFREGSEVLEYESTLRQGSPYTRDLLSTIPAVQWRDSRLRNLHHLTQQISDLDGLTVWPSTFGLILTTGDESKRDALHTALCAKRIYPAVLWPDTHDEASDREGGFSRRMLHVHTDQRYFDSDMDRVALVMRSAWDQIKDCP